MTAVPIDLPEIMGHPKIGKMAPVARKTAAGNHANRGYPKEPEA